MKTLPLRLPPGADLRRALEAALAEHGAEAGFVLQGIGSLQPALLRLAGAEATVAPDGSVELLTLAGSVAPGASHASVSDAAGRVFGGHLGYGSIVATTAEVLLVLLPDWAFSREPDTATGYAELVVRRR